MTLVKRLEKGSPLTAAEHDGNMEHLDRKMVDVRDFGALGNDVDDTAAIQAAIDAEVPIHFPPGDYRLTSPVYFDRYLCFIGGNGFESPSQVAPSRITANFDEGPMIWQARDKNPVAYPPCCIGPDGTWGYYSSPGNFVTDLSATADQVYSWQRYVHMDNILLDRGGGRGECMMVHQTVAPSTLQNCTFKTRYRGVVWRTIAAAPILNCRFVNINTGANSGLLQGPPEDYKTIGTEFYEANMEQYKLMWGFRGNGSLIGCDAFASGVGFALGGDHNYFAGGRTETCSWGITLGDITSVSEFGTLTNDQFKRALICSSAFEMNRRHIYLSDVGDSVSFQSNELRCQGPDTDEIGIYIKKAGRSTKIEGMRWSGTPRHTFVMDGENIPHISDTGGGGGVDTANAFLTQSAERGTRVERMAINPEKNGALDTVRQHITYTPDLALRGLTAPNIRDVNTYSKNLGGSETPAGSATSVSVAFEGEYTGGTSTGSGRSARISDLTVAADSNSTLDPWTYYYAITTLTKHGETGIDNASAAGTTQRMITVAAGESVTLQWACWETLTDLGHVVRIYRGHGENKFDGYWEFPADTSPKTFVDDGGFSTPAFAGRGSPGHRLVIATKEEDDANYSIVATPSWDTSVWISGKATTGFTINFGTAAPDANQTVQWLLFRS